MIVVCLGGNVAGWMCEICVGSWHREVSMNCLLVSSCCERIRFCRLGWLSAMNLGVVKWSFAILCNILYCGDGMYL